MLGVNQLNGFNCTSAGTTWVTAFTAPGFAAQGTRANYGLINRYTVGDLSASATAGKVRITFTNSSGGGNHSITDCYIGHYAGAGDDYDAASLTQVTVGGSGTWSLLTTDTLSDEISFALDASQIFILCIKTSTNNNGSYETGGSAAKNHEKSGATDIGTADKTGYSVGLNGRMYVKKIEVFQ